MGQRIHDLRWTDVASILDAGATAVLPIGAAAKEHGPHLPLRTDYLTAEALGARLAQRADVLVWPALGYGHYPAFRRYPGSTSVPEESFESTVMTVLQDFARHGAQRSLVLNTGISTIRGVDAACGYVDAASAHHVYRGERYLAAVDAVCEQEAGGHADEAETSVMLHLHPELVDMSAAPRWTTQPTGGPWDPMDESSSAYSPDGIFGDATLATADKGATLVEAMLEDLRAALE